MPLVEWVPSLSVGVAQFDTDHRQLVHLINRLYDALEAGTVPEIAFDQIVGFARLHFAHEEMLLDQHHYPELEAHRGEHAEFILQLAELQRQQPTATTALSLLHFLKSWLLTHILGADKKYTAFLNAAGVC
jgi:hemerythrin